MRCYFNCNITCPFTDYKYSNRKDIPTEPENYSYIRLLNSSFSVMTYSVFFDGSPLQLGGIPQANYLHYGQPTKYIKLPSGNHNISFGQPFHTAPPAPIVLTHNFLPGEFYTIVMSEMNLPKPWNAFDDFPVTPVLIKDISKPLPENLAAIRFVNLHSIDSYYHPEYDLRQGTRDTIFGNVRIAQPTEYKIIEAGTKLITMYPSGDYVNDAYYNPSFQIIGGEYQTLYAPSRSIFGEINQTYVDIRNLIDAKL